ncbi:hypothetical protein GC207_01150 [bacterium]|nr:hypothetical protein [bacterium]
MGDQIGRPFSVRNLMCKTSTDNDSEFAFGDVGPCQTQVGGIMKMDPLPVRNVRRILTCLCSLIGLFIGLVSIATSNAAPVVPNMFLSGAGRPTFNRFADGPVTWEQSLQVDAPVIGSFAKGVVKAGTKIRLNIRDGMEPVLQVTGVAHPDADSMIVTGDLDGVAGGVVRMAIHHGIMAGTVRLSGSELYVIQYGGNQTYVVRKFDLNKFPECGVTDMGFQQTAIKAIAQRKAAKLNTAQIQSSDSAPTAQAPPGDAPSVMDTGLTPVDVMVVYTAAARDGAGGTDGIRALIDLAVAEANDCFAKSQIGIQINLVHTEEVDYTETGDMSQDLYNLAFGSVGQPSQIKLLRYQQFKADTVCMITEREDTGYIAGIAYLLQNPNDPTYRDLAFSVVRRPYAVGNYTFAHEIGHNLGCAHDRQNSSGQGAFAYSYGNRFVAQNVTYATVMTYPPGVRIPYFSNPNVFYNGVATGIADPNPASADNAATINYTAPNLVSKYTTAFRRYVFSQTQVKTTENAGQVNVTVQINGTTTSNMSVDYTTSDGTAKAGTDYEAQSGTITFPAGQTNATISINLVNDQIAESPESFYVTLRNPNPSDYSALGTDYQATVTIDDDEKAYRFEQPAIIVSEAVGAVSLAVDRQGDTNAASSVSVHPVAGTATAGMDFAGADVVVDFAAGESTKQVTIPLVNDFVAESDKTFSLKLVNPSTGYGTVTPSTASVTLLDDDRPGAIDVTFNRLEGPNDNVFAVAARSNGKVVVGGGYASIDGGLPAGIAQFNSDGAVDTQFNPGIGVSGTVYTVGLRSDGKVVIGGAFTAVAGVTRNNLARLNEDGSLDSAFDPGIGPDDAVRSLAVMDDGRVVIGGFFLNYRGQPRAYIARVMPDGSQDATFNPGTGPSAPVRTVVVQSNGSVIMGGDFSTVNGFGRGYVARLGVTGALDMGFTAYLDGTVRALALMADGDVIAGGEFITANGYGYSYVARLNGDGTTDTTFNLADRPNGFVRALAVQSDQRILLAGDFTTIGARSLGRIGRLNADGSLDDTFAPGSGANDAIYTLTTAVDTYVLAGGAFDQFSGLPRARVARLRITPNVDTFEPVMVPLVRGDVSGGPITIHFEGRTGNRYSLDGSDDLKTWSGVVTNTATADATQLTDPAPPPSRRFYRVRQVP